MIPLVLFACTVTGLAVTAAPPSRTPLSSNPLQQQQWSHNTTRIAVIQLPAPTTCGAEAKSCTHAVTAVDMAPLVHYIAHAASDKARLLLGESIVLRNAEQPHNLISKDDFLVRDCLWLQPPSTTS